MSYQQFRPNSYSIIPLVVKNLLIINALFLLATWGFANKVDLNDLLGLHHPFSEKFQPFQFVTYMFMHADTHHLISNFITLWIFGSIVENYWGPKRFLTYYIITGIGAACIHYLIVCYQMQPTVEMANAYIANPTLESFHSLVDSGDLKFFTYEMLANFNENIPTYFNKAIEAHNYNEAIQISVDYMHTYKIDYLNTPTIVGASGSVFGVLLAAGMLFPNNTPFIIPIQMKWIVIMYGAGEVFAGYANKPNDHVAHFAHLGGMLIGFILIKYWKKRNNFY